MLDYAETGRTYKRVIRFVIADIWQDGCGLIYCQQSVGREQEQEKTHDPSSYTCSSVQKILANGFILHTTSSNMEAFPHVNKSKRKANYPKYSSVTGTVFNKHIHLWVSYLRLVFRLLATWLFVLRKARAERCSALNWMLLADPSLVKRSLINWIWRSCNKKMQIEHNERKLK